MSLILLIARRLKDLRAKQGLTQEELAQASGFSFKFYQQLESGRKKQIWLETVERLAAIHGLKACELIGDDEPTSKAKLTVVASNVHQRKKVRGKKG